MEGDTGDWREAVEGPGCGVEIPERYVDDASAVDLIWTVGGGSGSDWSDIAKKLSGITLEFNGKIPQALKPDEAIPVVAAFPQAAPISDPTWYLVKFLVLFFIIQALASLA